MRILVSIMLVVICCGLNAQKSKFFQSSYREGEEENSNIPASRFSYSKKEKIYYFISNNKENIFLDMRIEDSEIQSRILLQGLKVWINLDGKSVKKMGVHFPIGSKNAGGRKRSSTIDGNAVTDGKPATPLSMANQIELIGFISEETRRFPALNADTFSGSVSYDKEGVLYYQMKMPVSKLPVRNSKNAGGTMPFAIGIEYSSTNWVDIGMGQGSSFPEVPSAGSTGGGRRGSGGRGGSRGSQGSGPAKPQLDMPTELLWVKNIRLAEPK